MPKAEKGSVKDIGKRIKAKGLQKLKFYCQMCQKQCRDANGFKCHLTSDSHLRQMKIFSENASGIMDQYSKEFEQMYLETLRMRHGTARVNANNVYQQVIQDKGHIHMNATIWSSLTDFCKYLGKTGKCVVEDTERGWYVTYIERDATKLAREEALQKRAEAERAAEQALHERIQLQRELAAKEYGGTTEATAATALDRSGPTDVKLALQTDKKSKSTAATLKKSVFCDDDEEEEEEIVPAAPVPPPLPQPAVPEKKPSKKRPRPVDDEKPAEEPQPTRPWLYRNIVVRVINKELAEGKYFKAKAAVIKMVDDFTAQVEIFDSGDVLQLDQDDLETVVPKHTGERVRILRGEYRGKKAEVTDLNKKKYQAQLELSDGKLLERVDFDDFSKLS